MANNNYLHTENLSIGYKDKTLLSNLNLNIKKGQMICVLGENGSGKSTLIRTLLGLQDQLDGAIYINDKKLNETNTKELAKQISIVLTSTIPPNNFTVFELVALGRIPYSNWLGKLTTIDTNKIKEAIALVGITQFTNRQINTLSDGERQRVMIAKALAQDTNLIILDEPTAHLDVTNRVALLSLLKKLAKETNKGILISTHELELAIQVADQIWLIDRDKNLIKGAPEDLVLTEVFGDTFKDENVFFDLKTGAFRIENRTDKLVFLVDQSVKGFWTKQALEKEGYSITENRNTLIQVFIDNNQWILKTQNQSITIDSIEKLVMELNEIN